VIRYTYHPLGREPAPFVHVSVCGPQGVPERTELPAQLDTGADRTVIPEQILHDLGLVQLDVILLTALDGAVLSLPTYLVQITIRGQAPITIEAVASRGEPWILLGRDVLNRYRIILDGPGLNLELS
jgi:predicted aspartyl protease